MSFWAVDSMVALLISHCEMYALYPNTDENDCRVLSEESYTIRFERERESVPQHGAQQLIISAELN